MKENSNSNKFTVYIALGSNLGNRQKNIETAIDEINQFAKVTKTATIIETAPETDKTQPNFLNTVIEIQTDLSPTELLIRLHEIEHKMGRIRTEKNAAREIDLDILLYGDQIINQPNLKIPHPRMHKRPFVTIPLAEIKPS